ncbi:MAG: hypothetical protein E7A81_06840 [Clostridiales bacterium]|nr:hypothetical protein [Clostridiales bacterium]MDU1042717.1 hypothetical protein [Clostridiales bacterium]MDU3490448.1 hypothetical protein [Clostridiales bacterium]
MRVETIAYINNALKENGIAYAFGEWSTSPIPYPYFVGEFTEEPNPDEDGLTNNSFIITGTGKDSWLELMEIKEKIEELFPSVGGCVKQLDNNLCVAIYFENAFNVPTDTMDLKRIQINLRVKEWRAN